MYLCLHLHITNEYVLSKQFHKIKTIFLKTLPKRPSMKYLRNKNLKFRPPSPCTHLYLSSRHPPTHPPPLSYVRAHLNTEYYPLLVTQNRKALRTSKFLEIFKFFESLLDFLNDVLIGLKIRNENQNHTIK